MATIGLKDLVYSKITFDDDENESYGEVKKFAGAITADLSVENAEAKLFADDSTKEVANEFAGGSISLGVDDIAPDVLADVTGATKNEDGEVISYGEDTGGYVALGFRARKSDGKYRCIWLMKVKFGAPSESYETKKDSIDFKTPTIEGDIMQTTKADKSGKHPWKHTKDCDEQAAAAYLKTVPFAAETTAKTA